MRQRWCSLWLLLPTLLLLAPAHPHPTAPLVLSALRIPLPIPSCQQLTQQQQQQQGCPLLGGERASNMAILLQHLLCSVLWEGGRVFW